MKKFILLPAIICSLFFFSNCDESTCEPGGSQISTLAPDVTAFHTVVIEGSFAVSLKQSPIFSVNITGPTNLIDLMSATEVNQTLSITSQKCFVNSNDIIAEIELPDLQKLVLNGSADIISENTLSTTNLRIELDGTGKIELIVENESTDVEIEGTGDVELIGTSLVQDVKILGDGNYFGCGLASNQIFVNIEGSGNAVFDECAEINAILDGSGKVNYDGNPVINSTITGSGDIEFKECF